MAKADARMAFVDVTLNTVAWIAQRVCAHYSVVDMEFMAEASATVSMVGKDQSVKSETRNASSLIVPDMDNAEKALVFVILDGQGNIAKHEIA